MFLRFLQSIVAVAWLAGCSSSPPEPTVNEKKADALLIEGVDALSRKAFTEAMHSLLEANRYNPKSPVIWTNLGVAYVRMGEIGRGEDCWRKALQIDPRFNDARLNLGMLYIQRKHYPEAERVLKEAAKDLAYMKADMVASQLANIYLLQNRPLLAEEQLKIATRDNPGNCEAWLRLGLMQKERGDYTEAAESMRGATKGICYKNPQAHYELATILLKNHDLPQAKLKFLEIIQLFPTTEWAGKSESTLNMIR